jgi:hypothetical protein
MPAPVRMTSESIIKNGIFVKIDKKVERVEKVEEVEISNTLYFLHYRFCKII